MYSGDGEKPDSRLSFVTSLKKKAVIVQGTVKWKTLSQRLRDVLSRRYEHGNI